MKNKKGKIAMTITIMLACFVLAMIMFMQFKIVDEVDLELLEVMRESELQEELAKWKELYEETEIQYNETIITVEEYRQSSESLVETEELLNKEYDEINMLMGKTDVTGQGIEIVINDSEDEDISNISALDLMMIVNSLNLAGAEAISINDERIISVSDIVDIRVDHNTSIIKVNGQRILAPYVIKAIGNTSYLESELLGTGGHVNQMQKLGQDVVITRYDSVSILKYNDELSTKYIN